MQRYFGLPLWDNDFCKLRTWFLADGQFLLFFFLLNHLIFVGNCTSEVSKAEKLHLEGFTGKDLILVSPQPLKLLLQSRKIPRRYSSCPKFY